LAGRVMLTCCCWVLLLLQDLMQIKEIKKTMTANKLLNAPASVVKAILPKFSRGPSVAAGTPATHDDTAIAAAAPDVGAGRV